MENELGVIAFAFMTFVAGLILGWMYSEYMTSETNRKQTMQELAEMRMENRIVRSVLEIIKNEKKGENK